MMLNPAARIFRPGLALACLLTLAPVGAVTGAESATVGWTPALSMEFRSVQGTAISPDGSRVAYVVREPLMEGKKSEYLNHIWMATADGSRNAQFTRGDRSATSPAFSPDGKWLAFSSSRGAEDKKNAKNQVWLIPMSGGEAQQATRAKNGVGTFRWSPDGSRIAFIMRDPDTKKEKKAKEEKRDVILVDQNLKYGHLYVSRVTPDTEKIPAAVRLTAGDFHVAQFDWSPDGDRIVFSHRPDSRLNHLFISGDLSTVTVPDADELKDHEKALEDEDKKDTEGAGYGDKADDEDEADDDEDAGDGEDADREDEGESDEGNGGDAGKAVGKVEPLVTWAGSERNPRWSPDGRWVAFDASGKVPEPIGLGDLYIVAAAGGRPRKLTETPDRRAQIIRWSADSREVYLGEMLGTTRHVIAVPLQGNDIRRLTTGDGVVGSVSMTPDTKSMAFTWQTPEEPWDVFVSSTGSYAPEQITDLHASIERPEMAPTELLKWKAPDGTPVEGLLTYPANYRPGERYPLILNVHGGPSGVYLQSFTGGPSIYMLQVFAQEGYAVLRPNPRGSTGYGKEFRFANFKDWGYGDLSDLLSGVDHVIEKGVADPDRLFLMGWSYGGYMTSFAVTQTDRFKAASMGAGLPNLVSMVTTTDIGDYLVAHMGAEFWDDYTTYEKHSAIYQIKNVVTPTQVIHGANDLRVPFTQGQEFYRALQRLGVPTEMVVYPRTPHGPTEPKFLMDVTGRILTWFEEHLPDR